MWKHYLFCCKNIIFYFKALVIQVLYGPYLDLLIKVFLRFPSQLVFLKKKSPRQMKINEEHLF